MFAIPAPLHGGNRANARIQEQIVKNNLSWIFMVVGCLLLLGVGTCHFWKGAVVAAQSNTIYGNNADETPYILVMTPGAAGFTVTDTLTNLSGSNGRGIVVVGGTAYYTSANTNQVFSYIVATHTDNGPLFTVAGTAGLSTMAYDGTNFWMGDYSGTNQVFLYSPSGTLLKTVHLSNCLSNCDGLEYFLQGGATPRLIANRGDPIGPYDVYDTNGVLQQAAFIAPTYGASSGIAYTGTRFLTSDIFNGKIAAWDGTTGAFISDLPITGYQARKGLNPMILAMASRAGGFWRRYS